MEVSVGELNSRVKEFFVGLEVVVDVKRPGEPIFGQKGIVKAIDIWSGVDLRLPPSTTMFCNVPFVGIDAGILGIRNAENGRTLYQNDAVHALYPDDKFSGQYTYTEMLRDCKLPLAAIPRKVIEVMEQGRFYFPD
ncbi:MAG: hypothetical protein KJ600_06090 [Nanoarchaeota archaeon]|nr:hypothetical protein [Nanoarchaeota archaeon]MBU1104097.1 hypothetical protein [Nanoarchaeota archaeon]